MEQSDSNTRNVLILGGRAPATLELIRLLASQGYTIFIAESLFPCLSEKSKYIQNVFPIPPPRTESERFVEELIHIIQQNKIQWLIPTCEEVFYVSKSHSRLSQYCDVFTSSLETMTTLHDKWKFNQFVRAFHPAVPKTELLNDFSQVLNIQLDKFVLKPQFSRFAEKVIFSAKQSVADLKESDLQISSSYRWLAQERVFGEEVCSLSLCFQGKIFAHSCYRHPFTAGKGAGVSFQSFQNEQILNFAKETAQRLNYTGFLSFDFIQDKNGDFFPLECNPRITSGIHLFEPQDFNHNNHWLSEKKLSSPHKQELCLQPKPDRLSSILLAHFVYGLRQVDSFQKLKLWLRYLLFARDVIWNTTDPKPGFWQFYCYTRLYLKSRKLKMSPLSLTTHDIEWNGL